MWLRLGTKLWFGTWGHIDRGSGFPGEVRVIPPIGSVGITDECLKHSYFTRVSLAFSCCFDIIYIVLGVRSLIMDLF